MDTDQDIIYEKKSKKYILILVSVLILVITILYWFGLKFVGVVHGTYFTKEFYHYTIDIPKTGITYFRNVNPNEISHYRVVQSNETQNRDIFFTFSDSIEIIVITDFLDTTRKVMLKPYTVISVRPSQSNAIIHSNTDNFGPFRD